MLVLEAVLTQPLTAMTYHNGISYKTTLATFRLFYLYRLDAEQHLVVVAMRAVFASVMKLFL